MGAVRVAVSDLYDVIVVGGGPAGSTMAWSLARRGARVAVVERAIFPREKVCGDFVEPAGLRILEAMGLREAVQSSSPLPITATRIYFGPRLGYRGPIPYYQAAHGLPPYGLVVPRHILDHHLLQRAEAVSAKVYDGCAVRRIRREDGFIHVDVRAGETDFSLRSRLIVGADGAESPLPGPSTSKASTALTSRLHSAPMLKALRWRVARRPSGSMRTLFPGMAGCSRCPVAGPMSGSAS